MTKNPVKIPLWIKLMPLLEINNLARLSFNLKITFSHSYNIAKELKERNLIDIKKQGRINKITLTKKGKDVAEHCKMLVKLME